MLNENIRALRKSKGLSQEEFASKLNVVRQTVSKWENGLSVPDSETLIRIAGELQTPVSTLLGETVITETPDNLQVLSGKLEVLNEQLAKQQAEKRRILHYLCIFFTLVVVIIFILLVQSESPYQNWDYNDPEHAVFGVIWHIFEWVFVRIAPLALAGGIVGIILTRKKN
ncbi:MAG: helix-turn-helix transcriptional regulator [Erysipelotrichaceae bacterium]|nr:helix-turn-helix transcriptional regulator [Erysipelotrichaceae bacterium]